MHPLTVAGKQTDAYSLALLEEFMREDLVFGLEEEDPSRQSTDTTISALARAQQFLDPIQALGGPAPDNIREYDLSTCWPISVLQAHGTDGEGRFLIYPRSGEEIGDLWEELTREVRSLKGHESLLIRLDRLHLYTETVHSLMQALFYRDAPEGRPTRDKRIVFVNPDQSTLRTLYHALEVKNEVCMVLEAGKTDMPETWKLWYVGRLQSNLRVVLDFLRARGGAAAGEVEKATELLKRRDTDRGANTKGADQEEKEKKVSDAQRRLGTLHEIGLVERTPAVSETGKPAFRYTFFHPAAAYLPREKHPALTYALFDPFALDRAHALCHAAAKAIIRNDLTFAEQLGQASLTLSEAAGNDAEIAASLFVLGHVARNRGGEHLTRALDYFQRSLEIRQTLGDPYAVAHSLHAVGVVYAERGDADELALRYYQQSLELRMKLEDFLEAAKTMNNMANLYLHMGRFAEMETYARASLHARAKMRDRQGIASSFVSMAFQAEHMGKWERVVVLSAAGLKLHEEIGCPLPSHAEPGFSNRLRAAREALHERYDVLYAQGRSLPLKQALAFALERGT